MTAHEMSPLLVRLLDRLQTTESLELEFKESRRQLPASLWQTVSAFANTSGGWILLGVSDDVNVVGVEDPDRILQDLWATMRNPSKISSAACSAADIAVEVLDAKHVIVVRVPAAPLRQRPVYVGNNPYTGTYVRRHAGDYQCTKPEVDRMMRDASDTSADATVLVGYGLEDLDEGSIRAYRQRFQARDPGHVWSGYEDQRFLEAIGAWRRDREIGREGVTVGGLLLFGRDVAIRNWRGRHLIDYRVIEGEGSWSDRVAWEGNLYGAFQSLFPRLVDGISRPFRLVGPDRVEETEAQVALREAFVNLLVHADYAEQGASLIVRSADGFQFRNPGSSRIPEVDLLNGDRSDPRNPTLVRMFRHIGLAEEAGSGIPRILSSWRRLGFRIPDLDTGTERYEFSINLRYSHLLSEPDREWLSSLGQRWEEAEQVALVSARHDGEVDNLTLRRLTGIHAADATKVLGGLRARDLLVMIGDRRGARYRLGPAAVLPELPPDFSAPIPIGSEALPREPGVHRSSDTNAASSNSSDRSSDSSGGDTDGSGTDLAELATDARLRRRLPRERLEAIVEEMCSREALSVREISKLILRSELTARTIVRRLDSAGRLVPVYAQRTHPGQRYRTPESN